MWICYFDFSITIYKYMTAGSQPSLGWPATFHQCSNIQLYSYYTSRTSLIIKHESPEFNWLARRCFLGSCWITETSMGCANSNTPILNGIKTMWSDSTQVEQQFTNQNQICTTHHLINTISSGVIPRRYFHLWFSLYLTPSVSASRWGKIKATGNVSFLISTLR